MKVRENRKGNILANTYPVILFYIFQSSETMEYLHSIGNFVAGYGSNYHYHIKLIGFEGDRDRDFCPSSVPGNQ